MAMTENIRTIITLVEQIQRRATKFILNDFNSSYFDRLKKLNLLPLMYIFELNEVLFTIKSLWYPSFSFNITPSTIDLRDPLVANWIMLEKVTM